MKYYFLIAILMLTLISGSIHAEVLPRQSTYSTTATNFSCADKTVSFTSASMKVTPNDGDMRSYNVSVLDNQGTVYAASSVSHLPPTPPMTQAGAIYQFTGLQPGSAYYPVVSSSMSVDQQIPGCSFITKSYTETDLTTGNTGPCLNPWQVGCSSVSTTPVNNVSSVSSAPSSTSSAAALKSCSSIKFKSLFDVLVWVKCIIVAAIIPLIFVLAFMVFLWGVLKFMAAADSTKKEEGKKFILWGLIGLFVMVSVWGIIKIVSDTLGTGMTVPLLQTGQETSLPIPKPR